MTDYSEASRSLVWSNRLAIVLGVWAIASVAVFPEFREFLKNMGAFEQGPGAMLFQALTHEAIRYIALLAVFAVIIKELWLLSNLRTRFRINVIAMLIGFSFNGLFFLFNYLYVFLPGAPA